MADLANPANTQSQVAGGEGDKTKLFFGKYKTLEEAETGFKEQERKMHEATQQAAQWKELAETPRTASARGDYGEDGTYVPAPQHNQEQATQVLTNFYRDPVGTLRQIKDVAVQEAEDRIVKRQNAEAQNRDKVNTWLERNTDLKPHGDLLGFYVGQTDGRLAIESRLDAAAKRTRERLVELRGTASSAAPNPGDFVPGPSGSREGAPAGSPAPAPTAADGESQLAKYASERNVSRMKRPGTHH